MSTVEEIQSFCNNFIPAPFWVRVIRVVVPLSTRLEAGEVLIAGLGDDDIENVVGGREWWQRTAHRENGLDAEWISMKRDWEGLAAAESNAYKKKGKSNDEDEQEWQAVQEQLRKMKAEAKARAKRRRAEGKARQEASSLAADDDLSDSDAAEALDEAEAADAQRQTHGGERFDETPDDYREGEDAYTSDLDDMPVTLAIHGGAYLLGSITPQRQVFWGIARKPGGRVFAVEYRLSPQFPFPCSRKFSFCLILHGNLDLTHFQSQCMTVSPPTCTSFGRRLAPSTAPSTRQRSQFAAIPLEAAWRWRSCACSATWDCRSRQAVSDCVLDLVAAVS